MTGSPDETMHDHGDNHQPPNRAFIQSVREVAGWRVSPRQIDAALEALETAEEPPTPERVADLVGELRGGRSERQRRNADLWRALGAQLVIRDESGDPEAQREFIGRVRQAAERSVSDSLLLRITLAMAADGDALDTEKIGHVSRRLRRKLGPNPSDDEIVQALPDAIRAEKDARRQAQRAQQRRIKRESTFHLPARPSGRRPRGASYGGKRRRRG